MNSVRFLSLIVAGLLSGALAAQGDSNVTETLSTAAAQGGTTPPSVPVERTIFLDGSSLSSVRVSVAYHPTFQRYYSSNSGNINATGVVFGENGGAPISTINPLNVDPRGWYFNSNTNQLEIVSFSASLGGDDRGLIAPGLDIQGNLTGSVTTVLPALPGLAGTQTSPQYDAQADVLYSRNNSNEVNVVNRSDGTLASTITLDFAAAALLDPLVDGILFIPERRWLGVLDGSSDRAALFDLDGNYRLSVAFDIDVTNSSRRPGFANGQFFIYDADRSGWQGYSLPIDQLFSSRFESFARSQTGGWNCDPGQTCQDVFEIELEAGAVVNVALMSITGDSDARIAAFRPGAPLDSSNAVLQRASDFSCASRDMNESATFIADVGGAWQIVVGRDGDQSIGETGSYAVDLTSSRPIGGNLVLDRDDVSSQANGMLCRGEYRLSGDWSCTVGESCQDVFSLTLEADSRLSLAATDLAGSSVPRFALHQPAVSLGGINLLTNTNEDRECVAQDEDDRPPAYRIRETGSHQLAITRDWGSSAGTSGTYELSISAGDGVFSTPLQTVDDVDSLATGSRCGWIFENESNWTCTPGESCQDVYDIELDRATTADIQVTEVTGASDTRLALFEPNQTLSGVNQLTGQSLDYSCTVQNGDETPPPVAIMSSGIHRLAVGRDWGLSAGSSGNYRVSLVILDGYGGTTVQTVDDVDAPATGSVCP